MWAFRNSTPSPNDDTIDSNATIATPGTIVMVMASMFLYVTVILIAVYAFKKIACGQSPMQWLEMHLFKDPVVKLEKDRVDNKYFPFHTTFSSEGDPIFRLIYRPLAFKYAIWCFLFSIFCFVLSVYYNWQTECIKIFIYLALFSIIWMLLWCQKLQLDIEQDGECYHYYVGDKLRYKGNVRDIYIRIRIEMAPNDETYYYLILHGYGIEEMIITKMSRDGKSLKRHGKRMSYKLNLNFFDYQDESIDHCIRHMCGLSEFALLTRGKRTDVANQSIDLMAKMTENITNIRLSKAGINNSSMLTDTFQNVLTTNLTAMSTTQLRTELNKG